MQNLITSLPAISVCLIAVIMGAQLLGCLAPELDSRTRFFGGIAAGLAVLSFLGFLFALFLGLNTISIALTFATVLGLAIVLRAVFQSRLPLDFLPSGWAGLRLAAWILFFAWIFSRVIVLHPDGLYTSPANNYGDLGFHFSVVTSFADGDNFPPRNPVFSGLKFTYPFLIDFLSAFLHRMGASWALSFFIPNLLLAISLTVMIEALALELTGKAAAAALSPLLFFLSGGSGFIYAARDYLQFQGGPIQFLTHLPRMYTRNDELHLDWGNALTTLLVTQRSFMFGLPLFALIAICWSKALVSDPVHRRRYLAASGVLAGLLPLLHAHGFFSAGIAAGALALLFLSRDWLYFFIPAGLIALPQALWLSATGTRSSLFKPHLGWTMGDSPARFWLMNMGLFLLLLLVALVFKPPRSTKFYLAFALCFVVPNVVLLAPWAWDNIKVLMYWYLVSCPVVAGLLVFRKQLLWPISGLLVVALTASGLLDVVRALSPMEDTQLFTKEQLSAADQIRQKLPARALVACAPIHNSVIALTGRQLLIGYPGHLWSHGIEFSQRLEDDKAILRGGPNALKLLSQYNVDYVVIGPAERDDFGADEVWFDERFDAAVDDSAFRVYDVKTPKKKQN